MRALALLAMALLAGCTVSLVKEGQNPVTGCATDTECPTGWYCNDGGCQFTPRLCSVNSECDPGQRCSIRGVCVNSNLDYCALCTDSLDCDSGICAQVGDTGPVCAASCDACPANASCQEMIDGAGDDAGLACLPTAGSCF